jgi:hypothetical protein
MTHWERVDAIKGHLAAAEALLRGAVIEQDPATDIVMRAHDIIERAREATKP